MPIARWFLLLQIALAGLHGSAAAKELDSKLYNTFYLEGGGTSWVLQIRRGNTYSLVTPEGQRYEGWYNASGEEIGLNYGKSANLPFRHFEYKLDEDGNISFTPTKKDQQVAAPFSILPPVRKKKAQYICEQVWAASGKRVLSLDALPVANEAAEPPPAVAPPVAPALQPVAPVAQPGPASQPGGIIVPPPAPAPGPGGTVAVAPIPAPAPAPVPVPPPTVPPAPVPATLPSADGAVTLLGTFEYRSNAAVTERVKFNADGSFEYSDSGTVKVPGAYQVTTNNGVTLLTLKAEKEVRKFSFVLDAAGGLTLTRAVDDAPQFINDLSYMSPSVIKSVKYQRQ